MIKLEMHCPKKHSDCAAPAKLCIQRRRFRHGRNTSGFTVLYLCAVGLFISANPGAFAEQQGASLVLATNVSSSELWAVSSSIYATALRPALSVVDSRTTLMPSGTTPLSRKPDLTEGTQPTPTPLPVSLDVVMSPSQLMPSSSGMKSGLKTTNSLHATNALLSSAAVIVNSANDIITASTTTTAAVAMTTRHSMFSSKPVVVFTTAVQHSSLDTNSLMPELSASSTDNAVTINAFISTSSISNNNIHATSIVQPHAATSSPQLMQLSSVASGGAILQTIHSMLSSTLQRLPNSATISPSQSGFFQTHSYAMFTPLILTSKSVNNAPSSMHDIEETSMDTVSIPTLYYTQEQTTVNIEPSKSISYSDIKNTLLATSNPYMYVSDTVGTTAPVHSDFMSPTSNSLYATKEQTVTAFFNSFSTFPYLSDNVPSTTLFQSELSHVTTVPTVVLSPLDQTTANVDISLPSAIEQSMLNSNIFSSSIGSTRMQSYIEYSTTVLVSASATPPLYIPLYTSQSDVLLSSMLESEQMHSSSQEVHATSEFVTTKTTDYLFTVSTAQTLTQQTLPVSSFRSRDLNQILPSEAVSLTSSIDLESVMETTAILVESSKAVTSTMLSNDIHDFQGSSQTALSFSLAPQETSLLLTPRLSTAVVSTVTAVDANSVALLPVTITELSTVMAQSPSIGSYASDANSALSDLNESIISTTVLEETTLYLSPSVHFQAITPTVSSVPSDVTSTQFPGLPFPNPTQSRSMLNPTDTGFLEPSTDIRSSDIFVTSTAFAMTTTLPLTSSELTSMLTTLYPTDLLSTHSTNSLALTTKQLHVSVIPTASTAVQHSLNSNSYSYQSTGLYFSLSSNVEITSSQYASSSLANETSAFIVPLPPPVTTGLPRPSLQSSSNFLSSLQQESSVLLTLNLPESGTFDTRTFMAATSVFMTTHTASLLEINPSASLNAFDSTVAMEITNSINRTNNYILPTILSSKSLEPSAIPTTFSSILIMSSSPTPSLSSSVVKSSFSQPMTQRTPLITTLPPASMPSSVMTEFPPNVATSSLLPDVVTSTLPPDVDLSSDLPTFVSTSTPSLTTTFMTSQFPHLPSSVATSGMHVLMPTPTPTPTPIARPTETTLDTSFVTKPYWVSLDISLVTQSPSFNPMSTNFVRVMEENLARAYSVGKNERDERQQENQDLLDNLDPDNDPLLSKRRRRRAVTVDGVTVQVIDISRTASNSRDATMVFYVEDDGMKVPAEECQKIMNELDANELTHFLGVVVKGGATVYQTNTLGTTTPAPGGGTSYLAWFIPVIIIIALFFLLCCCCWFYCFCCRVPPNSRKQADGPMDPETLKMLKFKSKYPYRPYDHTPNQTPRGFDVAKEGLGNPALNMEDESKKANGKVETSATKEDSKRNVPKIPKRGENVPYGPVVESSSQSSETDSSPYLSTRSMRGVLDKDNLLKNDTDGSSRLASRSVSPGSSANLPPKILPKTDLSLKTKTSPEKLSKKQQKLRNARSQPSPTSENADEFKRVYLEAQKEISKILEPELFPEGTQPPKGKRRKSSKSKRLPTSSSSDAEFEAQFGDQVSGLPETHLSRKPISPESTLERQETIQDARRRVHALIDEAFSLVTGNTRSNAVSPAPSGTDANEEGDKAKLPQNVKARGRRHNQRPLATTPPIHEEEEPPLFEKTKHHQKGQNHIQDGMQDSKDTKEPPTRVLIVPISHVPDRTAEKVVWNPYQAEDDIARLNETQQLKFVPGRTASPKVPPKPKRRRSPNAAINQVLPPLNNLPETALQQSNQGSNKPHRFIANKHSPDGASTESESGSSPDRRGRHPEGNQNRTRNSRAGTPLSSASSRTSPFGHLSQPNRPAPETDLLSTIAKEQKLGKPIKDDYDELDVRGVLNSPTGRSHGLVSAVKEELMRLNRRGGDGQDVNGHEIGPI